MKDNQVDNKNPLYLLEVYRNVLILSENLVALAKSGEWETLISRETDYVLAVENLTALTHDFEQHQPITEDFIQLLHQIIENERITKEYLQNHLNFLSKEMKHLDQQKVLNNSYGQFDEPDTPRVIKPLE
ncbi:Flagellar protein FliT [Providencia rustigianii]|uniref:Flagellar protein FliT n=3 Tax=Providencia rustigianii TaxID=158850 RepID=D1NZH0_9GAMM|nr:MULTISPECIES: flagellar protein FliT [Providencia]EFB73236.1 flagellar protein FliT [Providencia rustigianii DSM 4541]MTC57118.1 flagellar protein FliT [Providencia rustigianii]MTC60423.1 flagellar protein FliT [Providencia rustigianii]SPY77232.1 Flagellar protein FliT [Providencia rustigianii]SUC26591.1 Flagellar protein FliT [Providencia rustigianii]